MRLKLRKFLQIQFIIVIVIAMNVGCNGWKRNLQKKGGIDTAVENAITDYLHYSKRQKDSTFLINVIESSDYFGVSIVRSVNKIYYLKNEMIFSADLPNSIIEIDNNLFYWDGQKNISPSSVAKVMYRYHALDTVENIGFTINKIDENLKSTIYIFCKENLSTYSKEKSKGTLGYKIDNVTLRCN